MIDLILAIGTGFLLGYAMCFLRNHEAKLSQELENIKSEFVSLKAYLQKLLPLKSD